MKEIFAGPNNRSIFAYEDLFDEDEWIIEDRAGRRSLRGRLIGTGSSQRAEHNHGISSVGFENAEPGVSVRNTRCTACRWSEIYIFQVSEGRGVPPGAVYCVYTLGPSLVRGENTRANVRWATSGFEVVELATVRRGERGGPFLPAAHARALAMAAAVDDDIANAYVNRAVA